MPVLVYGNESCAVLGRDRRSWEFTVTLSFVKLFRTGSATVHRKWKQPHVFSPFSANCQSNWYPYSNVSPKIYGKRKSHLPDVCWKGWVEKSCHTVMQFRQRNRKVWTKVRLCSICSSCPRWLRCFCLSFEFLFFSNFSVQSFDEIKMNEKSLQRQKWQ